MKVKLSTLTLLIALLVCAVLFNLLNIFNIQYFYIRGIFSFIFLITIPGMLLLTTLGWARNLFWEKFVYSIGLSLITILAFGVILNFSLPILGVTNRPLSFYPLLIGLDLILFALSVAALIRCEKKSFDLNITVPNIYDSAVYIYALTIPAMSIFGAVTLNNHGSNIITMVTLVAIPILIAILSLFKSKLNEHTFPWSIWMIGFGLLLMGWMRSWYVSGADINIEYQIFQIVKGNGYWSFKLLDHAYNACLSVTLLPTIFSKFMRVNDIYIFKFFIPLLFALTPVSVYLSIRRYADKTTALLTSFFFIAQPTFMTWWWIPVRQEVALLFYSFSVLALLDNNLSKPIRSLFFILFTFGMIVSHYSTSYISLTLFLFTYVFYLFYRKTEYINIFTKLYCFLHLKNPSDVNFRKQFLTFFSIAIPILFAIFWYSNQPTITNNFVNVIKKTVANVGDINNSKNKVEGASLGAQWNIFYQQKKQTNLLTKSQQNFRAEYLTIDKIKPYGKNIYERYRNTTTFSKNIPSLIPASIGTRVTLLIELIKKLIKVFIVFGTFHIIFRKFIDPKHSEEFVILNTGSLVAMLAILTLPVISIDYDLMRQYQQILVTLSYSCVLGGIICLFIFKRKALSQAVLLLVLTIFFLSQSGFIAQFVGGKSIYVHLNNYGDSYNQFYVHYSERVATKWLRDNWHRSNFIYADNRASFKLWYFDNAERKMLKKVVLPATIDKSAYVYSSYANTIDNISYLSSQGDIINHIFPTNFLEDNKSTIYNNGESKIYK